MREHALPQDVVGYRFHIIGNMTLKQFAELGGGVVIAFIAYSIGIPIYIKVPVIIISAGIGALAAFVPFEERPLDHWMVAFVRALYRPTQFYWKRTSKIPDAFLYQPLNKDISSIQEVDLSPIRRQRATEYMRSVNKPSSLDKFDEVNQQKLNEIMSAFSKANTFVQESAYVPLSEVQATAPPPRISEVPSAIETNTMNVKNPTVSLPDQVVPPPPAFEKRSDSVEVPSVQNISLPQTVREETPELPQFQTDKTATFAYTPAANQVVQASEVAVQNKQLPFPEKPTDPNKIVGMVIDANNAPIQNAIIEILTTAGVSARAVKTNILGQFFISTPLNNGSYTILIDKDGFQFPALQLTLTGQIVDPIEVRSL